jgi:PhnB protein
MPDELGTNQQDPATAQEHVMANKVKPIPDGYNSVTPYLIVENCAAAIDFYKKGFGATELFRIPAPDNKIGHAEIKIGNSVVMLADEHPEIGARSPRSVGGTPVSILVYVEDVDAVAKRLQSAGAKLLRPVENQFYGDRAGSFEDPFGHLWHVHTHVEDVPPDELQRRASQLGA